MDEPNIGSHYQQDPKDAQWPSWIPAPLALAFPQDLAGFGHHRPIIPVPIPPDEDADGPDAAAFGASGKTWLTSRIGLVLITSYKYLVVVSST